MRHREFIVNSLEKEPKLFLELLQLGKNDVNGLKSPMGLSRVLDELQRDGIVSQEATRKDSILNLSYLHQSHYSTLIVHSVDLSTA